MKAVRIHEHGNENVLIWEEVPLPKIKNASTKTQINYVWSEFISDFFTKS